MQAETRQTTIADSILMEMDQEAATTRRVFDAIPEDKLGWRPHPRARSLGELAMHIATLPQGVAELADQDVAEAPTFPPDAEAKSRAEIHEAFDECFTRAKEIVAATDDARAMAEWKMTREGATLMAMPRIALWRSVLLNHNYHHRGQLSVYLRELDVPVPSIYGPSADENPFS